MSYVDTGTGETVFEVGDSVVVVASWCKPMRGWIKGEPHGNRERPGNLNLVEDETGARWRIENSELRPMLLCDLREGEFYLEADWDDDEEQVPIQKIKDGYRTYHWEGKGEGPIRDVTLNDDDLAYLARNYADPAMEVILVEKKDWPEKAEKYMADLAEAERLEQERASEALKDVTDKILDPMQKLLAEREKRRNDPYYAHRMKLSEHMCVEDDGWDESPDGRGYVTPEISSYIAYRKNNFIHPRTAARLKSQRRVEGTDMCAFWSEGSDV